jgi:hypothetical protein
VIIQPQWVADAGADSIIAGQYKARHGWVSILYWASSNKTQQVNKIPGGSWHFWGNILWTLSTLLLTRYISVRSFVILMHYLYRTTTRTGAQSKFIITIFQICHGAYRLSIASAKLPSEQSIWFWPGFVERVLCVGWPGVPPWSRDFSSPLSTLPGLAVVGLLEQDRLCSVWVAGVSISGEKISVLSFKQAGAALGFSLKLR